MTQVTIEQAIQIALGHHQAGRLAEAEGIYRQVLAGVPNHPDALHLLGVLACQSEHTEAAIELIGRAIAINPAIAEYHSNLGESYLRAGQWEGAIASFRRAIELKPDLADAHSNLGNALWKNGRFDEAIVALRRAIALEPDHAEAHNNLGLALHDHGRLDEAIDEYHRAIALRPELAEAHNNLGTALRDQGRTDEAIDALGRAIALMSDYAIAHSNLGTALNDQGRLDEAIDAHRRAIALRPGLAEAHSNLGTVFKDQGRLDEALACFRKAVELKPDYSRAASNFVSTMNYHPGYDARAILAEHRHWARQFAEPLAAEIRPPTNDRSPDRKLRVGFVSPDFYDHPVGRLLLPVFLHHDRRQSEFFGYSDVRVADGVTQQLEALADRWHETTGLSDPLLADRIRADRIDILVDLALHTANNRMLVFARKPAPIQVTMLGMPATTGLDTIDYRLTDPYLDPPGAGDAHYTEQSIRLPHCFWHHQPPAEEVAPPVAELPALTNGWVTFGCLNQFAKVSRPALELWLNILQSLPASRLVIQSQPGSHLDPVRRLFQDGGIALDRVEFAAKVPRPQYFRCYQDLDLSLDPFPYNGHTSTLDSLWMGVPVITLAGRTAVGRGGASILSNVGLPELIAKTPEQYVDFAVRWASDLPRLAALRAELRQRMEASVLVDGPQFTADVEAAFRRIWQTWCGP